MGIDVIFNLHWSFCLIKYYFLKLICITLGWEKETKQTVRSNSKGTQTRHDTFFPHGRRRAPDEVHGTPEGRNPKLVTTPAHMHLLILFLHHPPKTGRCHLLHEGFPHSYQSEVLSPILSSQWMLPVSCPWSIQYSGLPSSDTFYLTTGADSPNPTEDPATPSTWDQSWPEAVGISHF